MYKELVIQPQQHNTQHKRVYIPWDILYSHSWDGRNQPVTAVMALRNLGIPVMSQKYGGCLDLGQLLLSWHEHAFGSNTITEW